MLAKVFLVACTHAATAGASTTGVSGTVYITPAHPGPQRIGESGRAPMGGAAVQVRDADHRVVAHVITGAGGQFFATVPPGEYWLEVDIGEAALPRCGMAHAIVRDGEVAGVELECDSGMR